jgi:hypothetical protein
MTYVSSTNENGMVVLGTQRIHRNIKNDNEGGSP